MMLIHILSADCTLFTSYFIVQFLLSISRNSQVNIAIVTLIKNKYFKKRLSKLYFNVLENLEDL